jgi:ATP-dependent DNA ligase
VYEDGQLSSCREGIGLEGLVAKRLNGTYGAEERCWIKTKNRGYWRYGR